MSSTTGLLLQKIVLLIMPNTCSNDTDDNGKSEKIAIAYKRIVQRHTCAIYGMIVAYETVL